MDKRANVPSISVVGSRCCGCGACTAACPVSCLTMEPDSCGFVHPTYSSGCIGCGKCAETCPVLTVGIKEQAVSVFWAKAMNDRMRERSSSGAVFGLLAQHVLDDGGFVYGAAFSKDCRSVRHVRIGDKDELGSVMRSKYVQSTVGVDIYKGVERSLKDGACVLFSGTACQNAALRNYLLLKKIPMKSLLLVEVVCHGVPSPKLWSEWLEDVSQKAESKVDEVNFRSKSTGWSTYSVAYFGGKELVRSEKNTCDWYMRAFLQNASLRESCLDCPAKRCCGSDITLGDFWGIEAIHPEIADSLGVSAVICNTEKGAAALDAIRSCLETGQSSMDEVVKGNPSLVRSVSPYASRDEFLADVANNTSVECLMEKWTFEPTLKQKARRKLSALKRRILG